MFGEHPEDENHQRGCFGGLGVWGTHHMCTVCALPGLYRCRDHVMCPATGGRFRTSGGPGTAELHPPWVTGMRYSLQQKFADSSCLSCTSRTGLARELAPSRSCGRSRRTWSLNLVASLECVERTHTKENLWVLIACTENQGASVSRFGTQNSSLQGTSW